MHPLTMTALGVGSGLALVVIPVSAHLGKLHVPGYVGIAILAFVTSFISGLASGSHLFAGSPVGLALSLFCFWSAAAGIGSILAIFFCRDQTEP